MPRNQKKLLRIIAIIAIFIGTNFTNKVKAQVDVGDSLALVASTMPPMALIGLIILIG